MRICTAKFFGLYIKEQKCLQLSNQDFDLNDIVHEMRFRWTIEIQKIEKNENSTSFLKYQIKNQI